jgi:hypothetical protein
MRSTDFSTSRRVRACSASSPKGLGAGMSGERVPIEIVYEAFLNNGSRVYARPLRVQIRIER